MLATRGSGVGSSGLKLLLPDAPKYRRRISVGGVFTAACVVYTLVSIAAKLLVLVGVR
jgi:hypothetical protein